MFITRNRKFNQCLECNLLFVSPENYLTPEEEAQRYSFHQNNREEGYVKFLNRVIEPSLTYLETDFTILDFGCGPNDVLAQLLREKGFDCDAYDPQFKPIILDKTYDFVFSTEVWEHFHNPKLEIEKIYNIIKPKGFLAIMTEFWEENDKLENWYYLGDPTHVVFYNIRTFEYIEQKYSLSRIYTDKKRVIIWQKT